MSAPNRPIAVTTCPRTRPCAEHVTQLLRDLGHPVRVFESDGQSFESSICAGECSGAIDLSLTDLAAEMLQTGFGAGPDRLTAAAMMRIPNVIVLGGLDAAEIPADNWPTTRDRVEFEGRWFVRTSPPDCDRLGQEIAFKASAAEETTVVLIPHGGLSVLDVPGGLFWRPDADLALLQSLRNWISPSVAVHETSLSIADPEIAKWIVEFFLRFAPAVSDKPARNENT